MPKRVVDGEGMARSRKLASVQPIWARAEYPWWLTLAAPNGVFELDFQAIWAQLYAYGRPDRTLDDTRAIGEAFISAKLLFVWTQDDKTFAFLVGSDKPGRCPPESWITRAEKRGKLPPYPPKDQLKQFLEEPSSSPEFVAGKEVACREQGSSLPRQGTALLGSGSGIGSGSGLGIGDGPRASHAPASEPSAPGVCEQTIALWNSERGTLPGAQKLTQGRRQKILARTRSDSQFLDKFATAVRKARVTPFLCGSGERGWKAGFDWFIANDTNYVAVLEGKYDGGIGGKDRGDQHAIGGRKPSRDDNIRTTLQAAYGQEPVN